MAVKRSVNWISQARVDAPDMRVLESAVRNDFDELIKSFITGTTQGYILRGFNISMAGAIGGAASGLQLIADPGAVLHVSSSQSGTFYLVPTGTPAQPLNSSTNTIVDGAFAPSAINYIGLEYERFIDDTTTSQIYLWNPTTNNETTKNAPRAQILRYRIKITTTAFAANVLPIATVSTDSGNNVVSITDARWMMFRLGSGGASPNPSNVFSWSQGRSENASSSTSNTLDPFYGGDKAIATMKDWMNAIMSSIQEIKGTTYWYNLGSAGSIENLRTDLGNTITTGKGVISHDPDTAGLINWDENIFLKIIGSRLFYKFNANPSSSDITLTDNQVAYVTLIRDVQIAPSLIFTNSSPTVSSVGSVAWTGPLQAGDWIKLGSDTVSGYYQILTVDSLSQVTLTIPYTGASTGAAGAKAEYAFGSYSTSPAPSTNRDIFIADRASAPQGQDVFWFLLRSDNGGIIPRVYVRFIGSELEMGETEEIDDGVPRQLLQYIGSPLESARYPQYVSALNPGSIPEITDFTVGPASAISSNQYFFLFSSAESRKYYVWFNKDGTGVDPTPLAGYVGVEVPISTGYTAQQVALSLAAELDGLDPDDFTAIVRSSPNDDTVRVTNNSAGVTSNASNFNVGSLTITVIQEGTGQGNFIINDGDNLTLAIKKLDKAYGDIIASLDSPSYDESIDIISPPVPGIILQQISVFADTLTSWNNTQTIANDKYGFWFVASSDGTLTDVTFKLGFPTQSQVGDIQAFVYDDSGGEPGSLLGSSSISSESFTSVATDYNLTFSSPVTMVSGQTYYIMIGVTQTNAFEALLLYGDQATPGDSQPLAGTVSTSDGGANWTVGSLNSGTDPYFILNGTIGSPPGPNELVGPVSANTIIGIPDNSRLGNITQYYTVGKGSLMVFINGQYLRLGLDWDEVGANNTASNDIEILQSLSIGDILEFRINAGGAGSGGGGGTGPAGPPGPAGSNGADAIGGPVAISVKNANYTVLTSDNVILGDSTASPITLTLPPAASSTGQVFFFKKIDATANAVTVKGNLAELIDGSNTFVINTQYASVTVVSSGTQFWVI